MMVGTRRLTVAVAAGLALADASIVTLALPPILDRLHTTVFGVAAVIGVYTLVLAATLPGAAALVRRRGAWSVGAGGALTMALASIACGAAGTLALLLAARAVQAAGAAALLAAAFPLVRGRGDGERLWLAVSVFGTATGPALGGLLTQLLDWRAIFFAQAPVAFAGAAACAGGRTLVMPGALRRPWPSPRRGAALALLAASLTAVLFLLVLLLVAGWALSPLAAALTVSVLPATAVLAHALAHRIPGGEPARAPLGCLLLAAGTA